MSTFSIKDLINNGTENSYKVETNIINTLLTFLFYFFPSITELYPLIIIAIDDHHHHLAADEDDDDDDDGNNVSDDDGDNGSDNGDNGR